VSEWLFYDEIGVYLAMLVYVMMGMMLVYVMMGMMLVYVMMGMKYKMQRISIPGRN
jgi:hypothetical protein